MTEPNWKNRTLFHGDNLDFLRAMNSESVNLIATDPPFKKGRDFHATPDSVTSGARFQDRWSWERDVHQEWVDQITDDFPKVMNVIQGSRNSYGDDMGAFLCFMAVRLLEMRRILRKDGSIYLHCDPTASHYLKELMDAVFGWKSFVNEIIWAYRTGGASKRSFGRKHDVILLYARQDNGHVFNVQKERSYLTGQMGHRKNDKVFTDEHGTYQEIIFSKTEIKLYKDERGYYTMVNCRDYWPLDAVGRTSAERYGYPTQKPLALYERMIRASSNKGDTVFDPFCGCATTCVAAERLERQWIGIDLWEGAHKAVVERLEQATGLFGIVHYETDPPERTDNEDEAVPLLPTINKRREPLQSWQRLSRQQIIDHLTEAQSLAEGLVACAGCGREMESPFMELDHITPRADRGSNDISNRILLCRPCNGKKSDGLTMRGLLRRVKKEKWMQDEAKAKWARDAAQRRYEKLRYEG